MAEDLRPIIPFPLIVLHVMRIKLQGFANLQKASRRVRVCACNVPLPLSKPASMLAIMVAKTSLFFTSAGVESCMVSVHRAARHLYEDRDDNMEFVTNQI